MKKILFGLLVSTVFGLSCSDDDDPSPNPSGQQYMTTTAGSSWSYRYVDNADASNNYDYTVTSSSRDTTASGKTFHVYENSDGTNEYYNITGSDYFTLQAFSLGGPDTALVNLYLKDGAAVGSSWTQNYTLNVGIDVAVVLTNTIQEKGLSMTLNGHTYTNVIHVKMGVTSPTIALIPGSSLSSDIHYYYAPKYGLIQNDAKLDVVITGILDQHTDTKTTLQGTNF